MRPRDRYRVILRVAGGADVGFGHVRRSWTLATRLLDEGADVRFVAASPDAAGALRTAGFSVTLEGDPGGLAGTVDAVRHAPGPTICVVDDPGVPAEGLAALREWASVACVDDTCERMLPVDVVVNGSAGAEDLSYHGVPDTRYLLGPRYILLRPAFGDEPVRRAADTVVRRVLVLTGGGKAGGLPETIVTAVAETIPGAAVDLVTGPFGKPPVLPRALQARVAVHHAPADVRALMLEADLAVSGAGQTAYELAASGTPALGMRLAANQTLNLRGLSKAGCLVDQGSADDPAFPGRLADALVMLAGDVALRREMSRRGRALVDGRGTERVAACLRTLAAGSERPSGSGSRSG